MTCNEWIKGVHRLGRARYICAHCKRDVSLELIYLVGATEDEIPPIIPIHAETKEDSQEAPATTEGR